MITRKVDETDALAGFAYNWVEKIGARLEALYVITWQKSQRGGLPDKVKIFSLPDNKFLKVIVLQKLLFSLLPKVDGVFCHMNPEYTILSAPLAKMFHKRLVSWYAHGAVDGKVRLMEKMADGIVSSSASGFRLPSNKLKILHQGIDLEVFNFLPVDKGDFSPWRIVSVGRISPVKNYEAMILAAAELVAGGFNDFILEFIGEPGLASQQEYLQRLKTMVVEKKLTKQVKFLGAIANKQLPLLLKNSHIFISMSSTGSLDKAILEAMACGVVPLTANPAFAPVLPENLLVGAGDYRALAQNIKKLSTLRREEFLSLAGSLSDLVKSKHDLADLADLIVANF